MHINLETPEQHAIQAYSDNQIQINSMVYDHNLIVSRQEIIIETKPQNINEIDEAYIKLLLKHKPDIIIIGHPDDTLLPPIKLIAELSQRGIGIEFMTIGAACRTYNVLLSDLRSVVLGILLKQYTSRH